MAEASHTGQGRSEGLVLVVDDDVLLCELQARWLTEAGYTARLFHDGESCLAGLSETLPDVVCLDLVMPGMDGFEALERIKAHHPHLPVIVMTAHSGVQSAVEAMKLGAWDYLVKPVDRTKFMTEVANAVEHAQMAVRLVQLEREAEGRGYPGIIGASQSMRALFRRLDRVAASDITVMIQGESGTGKEIVASAIHTHSARRQYPFVAVSCAAIPESLQESELFGHEKGAFTGATIRRAGCFERAHEGTLFLDEIGELTASLQAKLLRVLQARAFQRVGGSAEIHSDFRLLVATHRELAEEVRAGRFREDLFFRVAVLEIEIPPLRARADDIPLLASHFLQRCGGERELQLSAEAIDTLVSYDWPGNVRELENAMERAAVECEGATVRRRDLPARLRQRARRTGGSEAVATPVGSDTAPKAAASRSGSRTLEELEREAIAAALERHGGNVARVVRELGIGRTTLYRKIKKYELR